MRRFSPASLLTRIFAFKIRPGCADTGTVRFAANLLFLISRLAAKSWAN
jgi:hypothetical protein